LTRVLFPPQADTLEKGHGRIEVRQIATSTELNEYCGFPHCGQVARILRKRENAKTGAETEEIAYVITSLRPEKTSPEQLLALVRSHWCIESLHWVRDMAFDEDRCRIRTGHGPRNLASLRNLALTLISAVAPKQGWIKTIRRFAAQAHLTLQLIGA
jgi:predicted transposase YbfD/YdcC